MGSIYETGQSLPAKTEEMIAPAKLFSCFSYTAAPSFHPNTHHRPVVYLQVVCGAALIGVQGKGVNGHLDRLLERGIQDPAAGSELGVGAGERRRGQTLHAGGGVQSPAAEN